MTLAVWPRWLRTDERPTLEGLFLALATCRADLHASERARASLKHQLDHYIGQAIRARAERDQAEQATSRAEACLAAAIDRDVDLTARILALEDEVRALERSQENLTEIAESYRDQLRELRAAVTIGAAQRKGRR